MKLESRKQRHLRVTKKMKGTEERPRLVVFRSKKHIYAQLVNDIASRVIGGCSTLTKEFRENNSKSSTQEAAKEVGRLIAKKALNLGIKKVCFDRAGYKYHGRVKALAQGAREGGLEL